MELSVLQKKNYSRSKPNKKVIEIINQLYMKNKVIIFLQHVTWEEIKKNISIAKSKVIN